MDFAYAQGIAHAAEQTRSVVPDWAGTLFLLGGMFAIFYFLLIRPQQRERRKRDQLLGALKKGDRVVTTGGLHGTIVGLNEHSVILKIADQVKVEVDRTAVGRVVVAESDKDA